MLPYDGAGWLGAAAPVSAGDAARACSANGSLWPINLANSASGSFDRLGVLLSSAIYSRFRYGSAAPLGRRRHGARTIISRFHDSELPHLVWRPDAKKSQSRRQDRNDTLDQCQPGNGKFWIILDNEA